MMGLYSEKAGLSELIMFRHTLRWHFCVKPPSSQPFLLVFLPLFDPVLP